MIELNSFARIGKGVLSKAIGLQKNYKEVIEVAPSKLNYEQSPCSTCPVHQAKTVLDLFRLDQELNYIHDQCKHCSEAVWEKQYSVKYINELNQFGYQRTLKTYAIKLLLLYHFLQPDAMGLIRNVDIKDLSQQLGCSIATIVANNQILCDYGYCYISNSGFYDNNINVWLPEYKNYHKTAKEGGRGYLTLSKEMLSELLPVHHINSLRILLKGILELDNVSMQKNKDEVTTTYKKLQGFLPFYCKRNVIQKALQQVHTSLLKFNTDSKTVTFQGTGFKHQEIRKAMQQNCKEELVDYVTTLNTLFDSYRSKEKEYLKEDVTCILSLLHIDPAINYEPLLLEDKDYDSLTAMCVQYSPDMVKNAISVVYNTYINPGRTVTNYGGLIRATIQRKYFHQYAS